MSGDHHTAAGDVEQTPWLGFALGALCAIIWGVQAVVSGSRSRMA